MPRNPDEAYREAERKIEQACRSGEQVLDLSRMDLKELPAEIGKLTALKWLLLFNHQFTALPAEIGNLTALTQLLLDGNQLTALPAEIRADMAGAAGARGFAARARRRMAG